MSTIHFKKAMDCWDPEVLRMQKLGFKNVIIILNNSQQLFAALSNNQTIVHVCIPTL